MGAWTPPPDAHTILAIFSPSTEIYGKKNFREDQAGRRGSGTQARERAASGGLDSLEDLQKLQCVFCPFCGGAAIRGPPCPFQYCTACQFTDLGSSNGPTNPPIG